MEERLTATDVADLVATARRMASRPERTLEDTGIICLAQGFIALAAENERLRKVPAELEVLLDGHLIAAAVAAAFDAPTDAPSQPTLPGNCRCGGELIDVTTMGSRVLGRCLKCSRDVPPLLDGVNPTVAREN